MRENLENVIMKIIGFLFNSRKFLIFFVIFFEI